MDTAQAEAPRYVVRIGKRDVDFTHYPSLTLGDRAKLKKLGIELEKHLQFDSDTEDKLLLYVVQKIAPEVTAEELAEVPLKIAGDIARHTMERTSKLDSPFSTRSTTSDITTGGASAKSENEPTKN